MAQQKRHVRLSIISRPDSLLQELGSFLALETREELVVDRSAQGELLRINFNISYPSLSCEFATLDVSDALGTVRKAYLMSPISRVCVT